MNYRAVFSLRLRHRFYAANRCGDFQIEPAARTQRILKNHRCVLKPLPDGVLVITEADANGAALIPFLGNAQFAFHLRLSNPDFPLFTELEDIATKVAPLFVNPRSNQPATAVALQVQEGSASDSEPLILPQGETTAVFRLKGTP